MGTVPAVSRPTRTPEPRRRRTINVDNPWHETQPLGRISTQALGGCDRASAPRPEATGHFAAETLLLPDRGPPGKGSSVPCAVPELHAGPQGGGTARHASKRHYLGYLCPPPSKTHPQSLSVPPGKTPRSPCQAPEQEETRTARRLWSRGRAPTGVGSGERAGLTSSGQVKGTGRQGQKTKHRSAASRKPWYRPHHHPLEGAQGSGYVPHGSRPPKRPRATRRSPTASSAQSGPVDGPEHSPHAPCLSTDNP